MFQALAPANRCAPRPWRAASGALVLALVIAFSGACSATSKAAAPADGSAPPSNYKVTVAGDSISVGLGGQLRTLMGRDAVVKIIGEEGSGLARPDKFDWPGRLQQLAREFPPQVLVFSLSSNDAQDLVDRSGQVVAPMSNPAAWDAEYSRRLGASFDAFAATSTTVVWVGHVRTAEDRVGTVNRRVQKIAAAAATTRPFVIVSDLAVLLNTGELKATTCLLVDGVHLTVPCLDKAAAGLRDQLPKR